MDIPSKLGGGKSCSGAVTTGTMWTRLVLSIYRLAGSSAEIWPPLRRTSLSLACVFPGWEDHENYLKALRPVVDRERTHAHLLVMGDYNQRMPAATAPASSRAFLADAFTGLSICTAGQIPGVDERSVNHIAHSAPLRPVAVSGWSARSAGSPKLSDHFGLIVDFEIGAPRRT